MKKLYIIALSVLALAVGCQREEIAAPDTDASVYEVYATTEDMPDTKTYMSGTEVYWSSGDKIAVFYKNTLRKRFDVTPESVASKNATFLEDTDYNMIGSSTSISNNAAYYPFCDVICAAEGASYVLSNISLPAVQNYAPGSAGLGAYPMVAVTENTEDVNFRFRNVCGALMFQLKGYGFIRSVSIKGNSDEVLAGSAKVTAAYGKDPELALSSDSEADKTVTIDCGEAGVELDAETPVSFVFSLPPDALSGGFTITVTDIWGGSKEYSTTKPNTILRSKIRRMPPQEYIGVRPPQEGDYIDEYGVNHGQGVEIDGVVWAPVNCGYHKDDFKYGKLYQWGRKYGQGYNGDLYDVDGNKSGTYTDATVSSLNEGPVSLYVGQSEDNADKFYYHSYDWNSVPDGKLWNFGTEDSPVKTEYDPCPEGWRVPTWAELDGLCQHSSPWTTESDQRGYWFSGSNTYSDNVPKIFFLAAGRLFSSSGSAEFRGFAGYYWSSCPNDEYQYGIFFYSNYVSLDFGGTRAYGYPVRCVQDDSELIPISSVTLDKTSVTMAVGQTQAVVATITPANANHQSAHWWSDDKSIATVDSEGNITAVSEGTVTITAMAGMQTATCEVTVVAKGSYVDEYGVNHGQGVKIGETVWAPVNCGYHKDNFKYGKLYQWGRKYGQGYSGNIYDLDGNKLKETYSDAIVPTVVSGPVDLTTGQSKDNENIFYNNSSSPYDWLSNRNDALWNSGTEDNPVKTDYDPCPDGWRVPTYAELNELRSNRSSWTTNSDGQIGYWFSGASTYTSDAPQVFFPAAGTHSYDGDSCSSRGDVGIYWSSRPYSTSTYNLRLLSSFVDMMYICRTYGFSVRCVQE